MVMRSEAGYEMQQALKGDDDRRGRLSECVDGEADDAGWASLAEQWRHDADSRATWHAYHLIGDALRSSDLAVAPARDERLLQAVRAQLAREAVVLAPAPLRAERPRGLLRRRWMAPAAVAAGFVAVAGVVVVARVSSDEAGPALAFVEPPVRPVIVERPVEPRVTPVVVGADRMTMLRDARIDRYLDAHRQTSLGAAVAVPGVPGRTMEVMVLEGR